MKFILLFLPLFILASSLQEYRVQKTSYARALLDNDKKDQADALKSLIQTSKELKFNPSYYENKLKFLERKTLLTKKQETNIQKFTRNPIVSPKSISKPIDIKETKAVKKSKIIVIDPGHGGKDPGAVANNKQEKNIVLLVSKKLKLILQSRGYTVFLTRDKDVYIDLKKRTSLALDKNADLFLSLHINSHSKSDSSINGVETFFLSPARSKRAKEVAKKENSSALKYADEFSTQSFLNFLSQEKIVMSNKLAIDVQKGILNSTRSLKYNTKDRGVKEAPFWVLAGIDVPSVLIELGYITDIREVTKLTNKDYQLLLATGIANGIESFFAKNK
ncbi:MAG: N-acetylmuramoyl-L-alanine amidase (EC [uncultured Campylobacterales bacterium]|uniref:N-acetylmuramoyl-L-alanine amidase n=1 Tax=uncultured Campylobacterales bacterium TaxID=352960 RepID=A0A6S6S8K2_9BACT|nr:MAG: N-acetylmuramoyl-L-alanine amidase (EC [uncultured Campylobacterales bacterium]